MFLHKKVVFFGFQSLYTETPKAQLADGSFTPAEGGTDCGLFCINAGFKFCFSNMRNAHQASTCMAMYSNRTSICKAK